MPEPEQTWVTPEEAAIDQRVDARTVRRWARTGKIAAKRTPGGRWRIVFPVITTTTEGEPRG